jgi:hypothetical protein
MAVSGGASDAHTIAERGSLPEAGQIRNGPLSGVVDKLFLLQNMPDGTRQVPEMKLAGASAPEQRGRRAERKRDELNAPVSVRRSNMKLQCMARGMARLVHDF